MAERPPHPSRFRPPPPPPPPLSSTPEEPPARTYVVQFPKDQIYRTPPPENTQYAERSLKPQSHRCRSLSCCSDFCCSLFLFLVLAAAVSVVFFIAVRPRLPEFSITKLALHHNYEATVRFHNGNRVLGMDYFEAGLATLSHEHNRLGVAKTPRFSQGNGEFKSVVLMFGSSKILKPSSVPQNLNLLMELPVKMKVGALTTWNMQVSVACELSVISSEQGARIKSQTCQPRLH